MKKYLLSLLSLLLLVGCSGSINAVWVSIRGNGSSRVTEIDTYSQAEGNFGTVKDLKEKITERYKIPVDKMRVTYSPRPGDEPVEAGDDLQLFYEMKGITIEVQPFAGGDKAEEEAEPPKVEQEPESSLATLTTGHKVGAGITIAALTAAVAGVMKIRSYRAIKNRLINTYQLGKLTPLQNKVWMATALASYRIPWYLRYLVNNTMGTLSDFVGSNPRAVADLYYGHEPSQDELDAFIDKFFGTVQE